MMWSGLLIYWANDVYRVGWGQTTLLRFFPDWFYQALHIPQRLAEGMALHFFFMWLFVANGVAYVLYLAFSGEWRNRAAGSPLAQGCTAGDAARSCICEAMRRRKDSTTGRKESPTRA